MGIVKGERKEKGAGREKREGNRGRKERNASKRVEINVV